MTRALRAALALLLLAAVLVAAACGDDDAADAAGADGLTVLAAASLTDVFPEIDPAPSYSFAGSDQLAAQIREGAPADVYAAANERLPDELFDEGLVEQPAGVRHQPPRAHRAGGQPPNIDSVDDLNAEGVTYVMAAEGVPVGDYTREVLANLGESDLVAGAAASSRTSAPSPARSRSVRPTRASSTRPTPRRGRRRHGDRIPPGPSRRSATASRW